MSDRKYRPVYMFIFTGLILMVIMMNYSFNLIYYIQNRIYENAVKTLFPVETYFEDNYDENAGSVWVDSEYLFGMAQEDKKPATQTDEGVVEAGASVYSQPSQENAPGNVYNIADLRNYDFLMKFYTVTSITSLTPEIMRPEEFLAKDLSLEKNVDAPQILIFHTHSQEGFTDTVEGDTSTTIVGVGDYLTELLTKKGYNVIHDRSIYDYVDGILDRNNAYTLASEGAKKIIEDNPTIEIVIDLHRDGIGDESKHITTDVAGQTVAPVMFFNGISYTNKLGNIEYLYNPYIEDNLATSFQLKIKAEEYYPNVFRKIYIKGYRYVLHLKPRSMLIEAGFQTNTKQEVCNSMDILADIFDRVFAK